MTDIKPPATFSSVALQIDFVNRSKGFPCTPGHRNCSCMYARADNWASSRYGCWRCVPILPIQLIVNSDAACAEYFIYAIFPFSFLHTHTRTLSVSLHGFVGIFPLFNFIQHPFCLLSVRSALTGMRSSCCWSPIGSFRCVCAKDPSASGTENCRWGER